MGDASGEHDAGATGRPRLRLRAAELLATLGAHDVAVNDVLYAGYDELISMKVASGRPEDRRDIGALGASRRDE